MSKIEDKAVQILSNEGAQCGNCGDQPGDRNCPDCEKCRRGYVAALIAAGWSPRAEAAAPTDPTDDRRERYAAAIEREVDLGPTALILAREAAMAVADEEINEHRIHIAVYRKDSADQYQIIAELEKENARLRAGRAEVERLQDKILELEADLAKVKDLLRSENKRANDAIDREETAEQAALEAEQDRAAAQEVANEAERFLIGEGYEGLADGLRDHLRRKADEAECMATPCSPGGCEPGGEPCSTHERLMAHGEGDHELCEPDCGPVRAVDEAQQAVSG